MNCCDVYTCGSLFWIGAVFACMCVVMPAGCERPDEPADIASPDSERNEWPFDQAPNVAAITTRQVIEDGLPILTVVHYSDDHSWAFLCGTSNATEDGRVIGMGTAMKLDPTLASIADLPPGYSASRSAVGQAWTRQQDKDEETEE